MGAMTIVVLVLCCFVLTYLYVMGLCYLCDLYSLKQEKKREEAEKRRKEELRAALDHVEMRRKEEVERRKRLAKERKERSLAAADSKSREHGRSGAASAARARA